MASAGIKLRDLLSGVLNAPGHDVQKLRYKDLLFFWRFVNAGWKTAFAGLLLTIAVTALGSLLPLSGKVLIDYVVMKKAPPGIDRLVSRISFPDPLSPDLVLFFFLLIGLLMGALGIAKRYLLFKFEQEFAFNLKTSLFDHLLRFPLNFFKKMQTGYLMSRVSDDVNMLQYTVSGGISGLTSNIFYSLFGIAIAFTLSPKLAMIAVLLLPCYGVINYFYTGRIRTLSLAEREADAGVSREMQEVISGVETVKAFTAHEREVQKVTGKIRDSLHAKIKKMLVTLFANSSVRGFQFLSMLLILWLGTREVLRGGMTVGDLVSFASYMLFLSASIQSISVFHITLQSAAASAHRIIEIFRLFPEDGQSSSGYSLPETVKGEIRFEKVSFRYEEGGEVLHDISFAAKPGEIMAFAGRSGAGKSTIANLLLKFYLPQAGSITLDGRELRLLPTDWLRKQIGIVSQDVFLFDDSIENNIRYGFPGASRADVVEAAKMANIHDEIAAMTNGYETKVGERGTRLSAGQRQRISIARAFLKDPPILIFDEPSSALDAGSEASLKDSLRKLAARKTMFIIAHRMTTVELADKIIVLDNGKVVESGSRDELLLGNGLYARLARH